VLAGDEREALLRVADQLSIELGYVEGEEIPGEHSPLDAAHGVMGILNSEDELFVSRMRRGLARVAAALDGAGTAGGAVGAALDGAEMVVRGELVQGNAAQLPSLLPSFVFLVALPVVEQDEALELSRRTTRLVEGAD
jgi:hypothetical protein